CTMLGTALAYMAPAFFICRSSLAAAMQEGVAGFSPSICGACCCCPLAGSDSNASPSATPAAGRIPKTLFIPLLLGFTALPPLDNANSLRARKQGHARQLGEQPMLDDAGYRVEQARKAYRLGNAPQMGINNPVAAIGDKNVAIPPLAERHVAGDATFRKGFGHAAPGRGQPERDYLDRQRKPPQNVDPFGVVGN